MNNNPLDLNARDCDQLLECIEAWENQPASEGFSGALIGAMMESFSGVGGTKEERKHKLEREKQDIQTKQKQRKEDCAFLRAKLIQLRNRLREREPVAEVP